jgi:hypothetical protein
VTVRIYQEVFDERIDRAACVLEKHTAISFQPSQGHGPSMRNVQRARRSGRMGDFVKQDTHESEDSRGQTPAE